MHPSVQRGYEIGQALKQENSLALPVEHLAAYINHAVQVGDNYALFALGVYQGFIEAGGIVHFGRKEGEGA